MKKNEKNPTYADDFREVRGQEHVKRALEVAAAGGHNVLMVGPPGSGKTMLARRVPSILPPMTEKERIEVLVNSVRGNMYRDGAGLPEHRPFRAPHHTIGDAGMASGLRDYGGSRVGEAMLARHGVLFLDEFPEFTATVTSYLSALPDTMIVAAMNPCPCGYHDDPWHQCECSWQSVQKYRARATSLKLPFDICVDVPPMRYGEITQGRAGEPSDNIRERVERARDIQNKRGSLNDALGDKEMRMVCGLDKASEALLENVVDRIGMNVGAVGRILRVARTIADLADSRDIRPEYVSEAIQYQVLDRQARKD